MCKTLLLLKVLVDANTGQILGQNETYILMKSMILLAKSMILLKSAMQYNNSTTDFVVALYGSHLHVITPRQYSYLHRC